jgi:PAS domain S-box-containing protein
MRRGALGGADAAARHGRKMAASRADLAVAEGANEALRRANAELAESRAALREREERLRLILASATDYAIITADTDRRVTSWNEGAERLLGWSGEEIVGRSADAIFTPEDREAGAPGREAEGALRDGRAVNERWHVRKDGTRFWGSGLVMPLRDPEADPAAPPIGVLKVMRDETGASGRRRRCARASAACGSWPTPRPGSWPPPTGRGVGAGFPGAVGGVRRGRFLQLRAGQGRRRAPPRLLLRRAGGGPGRARAAGPRRGPVRRGGAGPAPRARGRRAGVRRSAGRFVRALGVRAYAAFPLVAGDGRLLGTLSFGSRARARFAGEELAFLGTIAHHVAVVRERLRAEAALREGERRLRATQDHAGVGIHEVDAEGRYARVSATFTRMTGYGLADLAGRCTWDLIEGEADRRAARAAFGRLVRGEADSIAERRAYTNRHGRRWWAEVTTTAVRDEGGRFLWAVRVLHDITESKRAEERRGLLVAELNHRVKNTLAVVQSLALQTARGAADLPSFSAAFQAR